MNKNVKEWKVAVIGSGTMGTGIAQLFAMNGHDVTLNDVVEENLDKAMANIRNNLIMLEGLEEITNKEAEKTLENLHTTGDLQAAVKDVDIVVESVFENIEVKKDIYTKLDALVGPETILASNTSSLNIYEFLDISHPERLVITHFFNPAYVMELVELVRGPKTSDQTVELAKDLLTSVGKQVATLNKVIPGFIINRISSVILREAFYIAEQGGASLEDVDRALVTNFGPRYTFEGPIMLGDFVGWDVYEDILDLIGPVLSDHKEAPSLMRQLVKDGTLGLKSGDKGGVYQHKDPAKDHRVRAARVIKMIRAIRNTLDEVDRTVE